MQVARRRIGENKTRESDCVIGVVQWVNLRLSHYGRIITGSCVLCECTLLTEKHF
jgi:hypothetical protein